MDSMWWFVGAMVLGILEIFTVDLTFAMLAGGALVAGTVSLLGAPLWAAILTFALVSAVLLFVARPALHRHFRTGPIVTGAAALVGRTAIAIDEVTTRSGRVKLNGEVWSARTKAGSIVEDEYAVVVEINGATAIVEPKPTEES